jgi:hypothetical protein
LNKGGAHFDKTLYTFFHSPFLSFIFLFTTSTSFQEFQIFFAMTTPSPEAIATFMRITGATEFVAVQKLEVV